MDKETKEIFLLLRKYMKHVLKEEGVTFTEGKTLENSDLKFTPYEINFLKTVSAQIQD